MKQIAELLPVALFFVVYQLDGQTAEWGQFRYQFDGIYSATAVLMIATVMQLVVTRLITGYIEKRLLWLAIAVIGFGAATLFFRNQLFIQWKPTIFNWALAAVFIGVKLLGGKTAMERALGSQLSLPEAAWNRLNGLWIANFLVVGGLNLYVAYGFSEATWVSYKLYSAIGFTILLSVLTVLVIMPWLREEDATEDSDAA